MTQGSRTQRVGEEFREILAEEIPKLKDPRVGFVTVTGVKVSPDLHHAWIAYTCLGSDKERAATRAALRSARPHLRRALGRQIRMKYLPELEFEEDISYEQGERIEHLIADLHRKDTR
ncbi:MAG: 30S ribosome-binding factor RbfA [Actinomycetota bacterium]